MNDETYRTGRATSLDPQLLGVLERLRGRVRRYIVWDSLLAIAAVVLVTFWVALAIDYLPVRLGGAEMPRSARGVLLISLAGVIAGIVVVWLLGRLQRNLPDDSLALLIERHHPELGGRLVTAVQLSAGNRRGDSHSTALLSRVHREAAAAVDGVDLMRVFRWEPIRKKAGLVIPLAIAVVVLAVSSPQTFGRAISRFTLFSDAPWPRRAELEIVGIESPVVSADETDSGQTELIEFRDGVVRLARGGNSTLRVRAADTSRGYIVPEVLTATYIDDAGNRGQSNLRRVGRAEDGYQSFVLDGPPLAPLSETVTLTIAGLDARLRGYRIEAIDPPTISQIQMKVRYPEYLRIFGSEQDAKAAKPFDQALDYQAGVRVREGSRLVLRGRSNVPLATLDASVSLGKEPSESESAEPIQAKMDADQMGFEIELDDLQQPMTIRLVPRDVDGISAQSPYRYFVGVVRDEPPQTSMRLRGIGSAITPIAKLPIEATATDDYGIKSLVIDLKAKMPEGLGTETDDLAYSVAPEIDRSGLAPTSIDLRDLADGGTLGPLLPESMVQLTATASDRFDLGPPHVVSGEVIRLKVVTPEVLLATLERRELEFRSRLEQLIDETQRLREGLANFKAEAIQLAEQLGSSEKGNDTPSEVSEDEISGSPDLDPLVRDQARMRLRMRQTDLQVSKSAEELAGIVSGLDDMLLEMLNNRVDSVDRRARLSDGVRNPLQAVVTEPLPRLRRQISELEQKLMGDVEESDSGPIAQEISRSADQAIQTTDEVLLALGAVLEKMLDLESFNEILDMVRGLIGDQEEILKETSEEQQRHVLDLFK